MNKKSAENILRLATDLLTTDPDSAHELVKNLRLHLEMGQKVQSRQAAIQEVSSLIQLAWNNPEKRPELLPIIAAKREALKKSKSSKKKVSSKKSPTKKTSMKKPTSKASKKKSPVAMKPSKKASPKSRTKKTSTRKRHASDIDLTLSDCNW